uniref:Histidine kinase n=1 Tax=Panagrellus redivivus TaxID=6233 RepID=A0A7E4WB40_PANRE
MSECIAQKQLLPRVAFVAELVEQQTVNDRPKIEVITDKISSVDNGSVAFWAQIPVTGKNAPQKRHDRCG